jgi:hypothetical protein
MRLPRCGSWHCSSPMHNAAALRADWMQASTAFNMRSATCRTMFAEKNVVNKTLIANKERRGSGEREAGTRTCHSLRFRQRNIGELCSVN